jgi:hypothetical protein
MDGYQVIQEQRCVRSLKTIYGSESAAIEAFWAVDWILARNPRSELCTPITQDVWCIGIRDFGSKGEVAVFYRITDKERKVICLAAERVA